MLYGIIEINIKSLVFSFRYLLLIIKLSPSHFSASFVCKRQKVCPENKPKKFKLIFACTYVSKRFSSGDKLNNVVRAKLSGVGSKLSAGEKADIQMFSFIFSVRVLRCHFIVLLLIVVAG